MPLHAKRPFIIGALLALAAFLVGGFFIPASAAPWGQPPIPSPTISSPLALLNREVVPTQVTQGEIVTVKLVLDTQANPCPTTVKRVPMDIILLMDVSDSMNEQAGNGATKLDEARRAVLTFLDQVDLSTEQVGLVVFNQTASSVHELSQNRTSLQEAISSLNADDGTSIADGLQGAYDELRGPGRRSQAGAVVILLSDGQSDSAAALEVANQMRSAGIRVVTVGLGENADEALLTGVAFQPSDYYYAPQAEQLAGIYQSIAEKIQEYQPISNVSLESFFDATNFVPLPESITPPGELMLNKVVWQAPSPTALPLEFNYQLRAERPGEHQAVVRDHLSYVRCESQPEDIRYDQGLSVIVQETTPEPNAQVPMTPLITTTPLTGYSQPHQFDIGSIFCGSFPWWLLLALFLAILFIILAWTQDWLGIRTRWTQSRRTPRLCQLVSLLLLTYLAFFFANFLNQFKPLLCQPKEAIYYWRIDSSGNSQLMYKPTRPDWVARPMDAVNKLAGCAGCHTVSRQGKKIAVVLDGSNGRITVMGLDGTPVDIPPLNGSYLSWNPDGTKLAYSADDKDIYILDLVSKTITPLVGASDPNVVETMPAWSSDGQTIAFVRPVSGSEGFAITVPTDIYTVPASGGRATLLPGASGNGFNYYPVFSPNSRWLAFTRHTVGSTTYSDDSAEIYLVPAQGGQAIRLAANDAPGGVPLTNVSNSWATWSPDSQYLAFSSKRNGGQYDIFITNIDQNGQSGPAELLSGASSSDAFEHLPFWGEPPLPNILYNLLNMWPWLLPIPLFLFFLWLACRRLPPPRPTLELERRVSPDRGRLGRDPFKVQLILKGDASECGDIVNRKPVDVALVVDVSSSMEGAKLDGAKDAARLFLDKLNIGQDQVAIVSFSDDAYLIHDLNADRNGIYSGIGRLSSMGGTSIHAGLQTALNVMKGGERRVEAEPAIILLSDGQSDPDAAIKVAEEIRENGIRLVAIGVGGDAAQDLLHSLATTPQDFYFSPDAGGLVDIYRSIAETIHKPVAATNIDLIHQFDAANFKLVPGSIFPLPKAVSDNTIIWHLEHIGTVQRFFHYSLQAKNPGEFTIDQGDQINYLRCGQDLSRLKYPPALPVSVVEWKLELPPQVRKSPELFVIYRPQVLWQPDEALVIGVGGTGRWVLTHLKKNLKDAGAGTLPPQTRLVVVDTSEYELINQQKVPVEFADTRIEPEDVFVLNENLEQVIRKMNDEPAYASDVQEWFPAANYVVKPDNMKDLAQGTHGSRSLARLGLVRDVRKETKSSDGKPQAMSRLWEMLKDGTRVAKGKEGVRIMIIGSLAGGMSGILFDIAYLARRAAMQQFGDDINIRIEAYLVLDSAFAQFGEAHNQRASNTIAALRELRRFQLNPAMPYPMIYQQGKQDPILANSLDRVMFDDVFLFGSHGKIGNQPQYDLFPAIADIVSLRLDRAAGGAGAADFNRIMQNKVQEYRQQYHDLAIGTAGSFVYRLPINDIMQRVQLRWVQALLYTFLVGTPEGRVRYDPAIVEDPYFKSNSPDYLAMAFLQGNFEYLGDDQALDVENQLWLGARLISSLLQDTLDASFENSLQQLRRQKIDEVRQTFEKGLYDALEYILVGTIEAISGSQARVGKMGYALAFIEVLRSKLDDAQLKIKNQHDQGSSTNSRSDFDLLKKICNEYQQAAEAVRVELRTLAEAISRQAARKANGPLGLVDEIDASLQKMDEFRKQMGAIRVRKYLWSNVDRISATQKVEHDIAESLYRDYARDQNSPENYVEWLSWQVMPGKELVLNLHVKRDNGAEDITLHSPQDIPVFKDALLEMAGSVLKQAWQAYQMVDVMESHGLLDPSITPMIADFREQGVPILGTDSTAGSAPRRAILATSQDLQNRLGFVPGLLFKQPLEPGIKDIPVTVLPMTDPYSCLFIRTLDAVSLTSINNLMQLSSSSLAYYLTDETRRVVFPCEAHAEAWERVKRVEPEKDGLQGVMLHPLIVAGLANPMEARLFALVVASGWVVQQGNQVFLAIPGSDRRLLVKSIIREVAPFVHAYLQFTLKPDAQLIQQVAQHVDRPNDTLLKIWRDKWVRSIPNEYLTGLVDHMDLGKFVRLVVRYEAARIFREDKR